MNKHFLFFSLLLLIPLVSAFSVEELMQEPWFVFFALFAVFFAFIYAVLQKTAIKKNVGAATIIALIISFLATFGIFQERFIAGLSVIEIFIIAAIAGVCLFLLVTFCKAAYFNLGLGGVFIILGIFVSVFYFLPKISLADLPDWLVSISEISLYIGIPLVILGIILIILQSMKQD